MKKNILVIPGDGIGPEVIEQGLILLDKLTNKYKLKFEYKKVDWGADRWLKDGVGIPEGELENIPKKYDAILFGALGDPRIPDMAHGREILLSLRTNLDLYINLRPIELLNNNLTPLKSNKKIKFCIFRENTEGIYLGHGGIIKNNTSYACSIDQSVHTQFGISRLIRAGFEYAQKNKISRVTLVDKSNAIKFGGSLWQQEFQKIKNKFANIGSDHLFVDVAAMKLVQEPENFGVIITSNLFGDILSDLGAGLIGGLGLAASGNINPDKIGLFEPVHGSAPDLVGTQKANPMAVFLSIALMLDYFEQAQEADLIRRAIKICLHEHLCTPDVGGTLTTQEVSQALIEQI